jgi:hypothetical protein
MSIEQIIIFYLIIAVWWNAHKWMKSNKMIKDLKNERDKYKNAWINDSNLVLWEKNEKTNTNR